MSNKDKTIKDRINLLNESACLKAAEHFHEACEAYAKAQEKTIAAVEKLEQEYKDKITKLETQLEAEKKKRLANDETKRYAEISTLTNLDAPLKTILYLLNTRFVGNQWQVLSSDKKTIYKLAEDLSYCTCPAFSNRKGDCPHIPAIALRTRIQWSKLQTI